MKSLAKALLLLLLAVVVTAAAPLKPDWQPVPFSYYAKKQSLADVFTNFGLSVDTDVVVSDKVKGNLDGIFYAATPQLFLLNICKKHALDWYFDGQTIHISRIADRMVKKFKALDGDVQALTERILMNPAWQPQFKMVPAKDGVVVTAPERLIAKLGRSLKRPPRTGQFTSRVFPLKNSWAGDKSFSYRDKSVSFPGVVTTLKQLYGGGSGGGGGAATPTAGPAATGGVGGALSPLAGVLGEAGIQKPAAAKPGAAQAGTAQAGTAQPGGRFQADERLNAVVVYDLESRMPMYEDIIYRLDAPSALVEIEALMIDIDTNSMDELGVTWTFRDNNISIVTSSAAIAGSTLVSASNGDFFVHLKALEQEGKAKILSRPSVLTVDNVEALLDLHQTFHVKVQGERVANLYPVTTGTMLRVTPHITERDGGPGVYVAISIQDGQMEQQQVDDIPLIKNNTINTQAFIGEGQSLLIGGYYYESTTTGREGVPILSDLPLIGWAFRSDTESTKKSERVYLITPKILAGKNPTTPANPSTAPRTNPAAETPPKTPIGASSPPPELSPQIRDAIRQQSS